MTRLHWTVKKSYQEASVSKAGLPGLVDTFTAVILPNDDNTCFAYVRLPHGQKSVWHDGILPSVRAARRWARRELLKVAG